MLSSSVASADCQCLGVTPNTFCSRVSSSRELCGRLARKGIFIRTDRGNPRDGERHSAKSQAVHDRTGKAMPARLAACREMDKTFGLRAALAQIPRRGGDDAGERIRDQRRGSRRSDLVGDDPNSLRSRANRTIVRRKLAPRAA